MDKKTSKIILIIAIAIALLSIVGCIVRIGISTFLIPVIVLWAAAIFFIYKYLYKTLKIVTLIAVILATILTTVIVIISRPGMASTLTCNQLAEMYDGKIIKITGTNFQGQVGITANKETCEYTLTMQDIFYNEKIVQNPIDSTSGTYLYTTNFARQKETVKDADGTINAAAQNTDKLPTDAFSMNTPYQLYGNSTGDSKYFYHTMQFSGSTFSLSVLEEILTTKKFEVYDLKPCASIEDKTLKLDQDKCVQGTPIATYNISLSL